MPKTRLVLASSVLQTDLGTYKKPAFAGFLMSEFYRFAVLQFATRRNICLPIPVN